MSKAEWIIIQERPIEFDKVAYIKSPQMGVWAFVNEVSIFEHDKYLYEILTATHWMPLPESPE